MAKYKKRKKDEQTVIQVTSTYYYLHPDMFGDGKIGINTENSKKSPRTE